MISCNKEEVKLDPLACFTFTEAGIITDDELGIIYTPAVFSNCSENASSYLWDFGDDSLSTDFEPTHTYFDDGKYIVSLMASNNSTSDLFIDTLNVEWQQVDKPNIYIYPDSTINLCVSLKFPQGGRVTNSIPAINKNEWCVKVDSNGKINNLYDFLFYESIQPDIWQIEKGWCISTNLLEDFFMTNMQDYNFNDKEIADFLDHWIPILNEYEYYKIYPQTSEIIETVIELGFSSQPNNVWRLFYGVIGCNEFEEIPVPEIEVMNRNGFTVIEWGVFRK